MATEITTPAIVAEPAWYEGLRRDVGFPILSPMADAAWRRCRYSILGAAFGTLFPPDHYEPGETSGDFAALLGRAAGGESIPRREWWRSVCDGNINDTVAETIQEEAWVHLGFAAREGCGTPGDGEKPRVGETPEAEVDPGAVTEAILHCAERARWETPSGTWTSRPLAPRDARDRYRSVLDVCREAAHRAESMAMMDAGIPLVMPPTFFR